METMLANVFRGVNDFQTEEADAALDGNNKKQAC